MTASIQIDVILNISPSSMGVNSMSLGALPATGISGTVATYANLPDINTIAIGKAYYISSLSIMAMSMGDHWEYSDIPARTWANILAITTSYLAAGMTCRASDLSLHTFIWDGSNWQSLNGGKIRVGTSRTFVTTTVVGDTVAYSFTIPGGLLGNGGGRIILHPKCSFTANVNTKEVWLKDTVLTNIVSSAIASGTAVVGLTGPIDCVFESATSIDRILTKAASLPYANVVGSTITPDTTVSRAYQVGISLVSGDSATFRGYDAYVERRTV